MVTAAVVCGLKTVHKPALTPLSRTTRFTSSVTSTSSQRCPVGTCRILVNAITASVGSQEICA